MQEAEQRAAQVTGQLIDARKAWDAERASLQGRLAEADEQRNALTAREAQACSRASTLQLQLQAAESARGRSLLLARVCQNALINSRAPLGLLGQSS